MIEPTIGTIKYELTRVREYIEKGDLRLAEQYLNLVLASVKKLREQQAKIQVDGQSR